jgi:hypothetical protein
VIEKLPGLVVNLTVDAQHLQSGLRYWDSISLSSSHVALLGDDRCRRFSGRVRRSREDQKQTVDHVADLSRQIKEAKVTSLGVTTREHVSGVG